MVYEAVESLPINEVISYGDLDEILGEDSHLYRGSIYRASKELMKSQKRMLVAERGEGYRVVEGMDIYRHAEGRHDRAERQIKVAGFEARHIDAVKLTPDQRNTLNNFMMGNREIAMAIKNNIEAIETGIQATRTQLTGVQAQVAGANITQLFTEEQVRKLKGMLGDK